MSPSDIYRTLVQLASCCASPCWIDERSVFFETTKGTASLGMLLCLKEAEFDPRFQDPTLQRKLDRGDRAEPIPIGTRIELEVPRSLSGLVVVKSVENLLKIPGTTSREPEAYIYLPSSGSSLLHLKGDPCDTIPLEFRRYHQAVELWSLLAARADHLDQGTEALLFFGIRRVEIRPIFQARDLNREIEVRKIRKFCGEPDMEEVKTEIFLTELSDLVRDYGPETSFRNLLRQTSKFAQRLRESLAIYLSTNSPARLVEEARSEALGLSEKIEKIVAGIELKALSIPAAVLLGIKDLEKGAKFTTLNCILVTSTGLFSLTMLAVYFSQRAIIKVLRATVANVQRDFTDRGLDQNNPALEVSFSALTKRLNVAERASLGVVILSFFPIIALVFAMLWGKPSAVPTGAPSSQQTPPSISKEEGKGANSSGTYINPASSRPSPDSWLQEITSETAPYGKASADSSHSTGR